MVLGTYFIYFIAVYYFPLALFPFKKTLGKDDKRDRVRAGKLFYFDFTYQKRRLVYQKRMGSGSNPSSSLPYWEHYRRACVAIKKEMDNFNGVLL